MPENAETITKLQQLTADLTDLIDAEVNGAYEGDTLNSDRVTNLSMLARGVACLAQAEGNLAKSAKFAGGKSRDS